MKYLLIKNTNLLIKSVKKITIKRLMMNLVKTIKNLQKTKI